MKRLFCLLAFMASFAAHSATLSCPGATTLEALVDCISRQMPQDSSNGYVAPNATERADFQAVTTQMLQGQCGFALPASLAANMSLSAFADATNGRSYCVLMETADNDNNGFVDKGWGTFITYANATREISHQAPHPKFDINTTGSDGDAYTERETIRIFKQTDARSYLMAGARRSADRVDSPCQPGQGYWKSDCAHNADNMFLPANIALNNYYGARDWTAIQWHGKASSTCNDDMFMSIGFDANPPAGSKVLNLKQQIQLQQPTWVVETPSTSNCSLNATSNVEGRYLNGVDPALVCGTAASAPTQKFMHIEQTVTIIGADLNGVATSWANAVNAAFPAGGVVTSAPPPPAGLTASASRRKIALTWSASSGASSYNVKRSTVSGGPYATVATSVIGNTYTNTGLNSQTTYYYVVTAVNAVGESGSSNEASATAK